MTEFKMNLLALIYIYIYIYVGMYVLIGKV